MTDLARRLEELKLSGNKAFSEKRYADALAYYEETISLDPSYADGWSNKSVVLRKIGRIDEAIAAAKKAIELNPNNENAKKNLAICLRERGGAGAAPSPSPPPPLPGAAGPAIPTPKPLVAGIIAATKPRSFTIAPLPVKDPVSVSPGTIPPKELAKIDKKLTSGNLRKQVEALQDLIKKEGIDPQGLPDGFKEIVRLSASPSQDAAKYAFRVLGNMGHLYPTARPHALEAIARGLSGPFGPDATAQRCAVVVAALKALVYIADRDANACVPLIPHVERLLKPPAYRPAPNEPHLAETYAYAAHSLLSFALAVPDKVVGVVPVILQRMEDGDLKVQAQSGRFLRAIAHYSPEALLQAGIVERFIPLLTYPKYRPDRHEPASDDYYLSIVHVLGCCAEANPGAVAPAAGVLMNVMNDTYKHSKWNTAESASPTGMRGQVTAAIQILVSKSPGRVADSVIEGLLSPHKEVQAWTQGLLDEMLARNPREFAPTLCSALGRADQLPVYQFAVLKAGQLGEIDPALVEPGMAGLIASLESRYAHVRAYGAQSIAAIAKGSPTLVQSALPKLGPLLKDTNERVRVATIEAIDRLATADPKMVFTVIPYLIEAQMDSNLAIRRRSVVAMKRMGVNKLQYQKAIEVVKALDERIEEIKHSGIPVESLLQSRERVEEALLGLDFDRAIELASQVEDQSAAIRQENRPEISAYVTEAPSYRVGEWSEIKVDMVNTGTAHARDIQLVLDGPVEVKGSLLLSKLEIGAATQMNLSIKPQTASSFTLGLIIRYADYDGNKLQNALQLPITLESLVAEPAPAPAPPPAPAFHATSGFVQPPPTYPSAHPQTPQAPPAYAVPPQQPAYPQSHSPPAQPAYQPQPAQSAPAPAAPTGVPAEIHCRFCGEKIPADSIFCFKCGAKLA